MVPISKRKAITAKMNATRAANQKKNPAIFMKRIELINFVVGFAAITFLDAVDLYVNQKEFYQEKYLTDAKKALKLVETRLKILKRTVAVKEVLVVSYPKGKTAK